MPLPTWLASFLATDVRMTQDMEKVCKIFQSHSKQTVRERVEAYVVHFLPNRKRELTLFLTPVSESERIILEEVKAII